MLKHFLLAAYIFSLIYCYLQLNVLIDRCVESFKERHPALPMDEPIGWKGIKLTAELLLISAVPLANLGLGYFCSTLGEPLISEIINNVEVNHWEEIKEFEKAVMDLTEAAEMKE